jgi:hypothetical protein
VDDWFIMLEVASSRRDRHKPRHLDLLSLTSVRSVSHAIWHADADGFLQCSVMAPDRKAVHEGAVGGHVSEVMVEVE